MRLRRPAPSAVLWISPSRSSTGPKTRRPKRYGWACVVPNPLETLPSLWSRSGTARIVCSAPMSKAAARVWPSTRDRRNNPRDLRQLVVGSNVKLHGARPSSRSHARRLPRLESLRSAVDLPASSWTVRASRFRSTGRPGESAATTFVRMTHVPLHSRGGGPGSRPLHYGTDFTPLCGTGRGSNTTSQHVAGHGGRSQARCQGEGRGFESRRPLQPPPVRLLPTVPTGLPTVLWFKRPGVPMIWHAGITPSTIHWLLGAARVRSVGTQAPAAASSVR